MIKLLHTSDWHLGRSLYGRKRYDEFRAFLDWLAARLVSESVDVLLVAGDIFDSSTPSNRAQELYYSFLCRVSESPCRHVVIIGGNHDSPSLLNAPREVLRFLDIHIIGSISPADEVLVLKDEGGRAEMIVCAVPFLRDRDVREARAGETLEDKGRKLVEGIAAHYEEVCAIARRRRAEEGGNIPLVAMGHLFTSGGRTSESDGVRDLYIGSLAHLDGAVFPDCIDYLALGHLHISQKVGGSQTRRYSGSPLPMGFGEAGQEKSVLLVTFDGASPSVAALQVPHFLTLETVSGDMPAILERLGQLARREQPAVVEVVYEGEALAADLQHQLQEAVTDSCVDILRIVNRRIQARSLQQSQPGETLAELSIIQVFDRCLAAHHVPEEQCRDLRLAFREAVASLDQDDVRAE